MPPPMMTTFPLSADLANAGAAVFFSSTGIASVVLVENLCGIVVEADAPFWRFGRRREERLQFRPDGAQRRILFQQRPVNFRQPLEDRRVRRQLLAHLHRSEEHT